MVSPSPQETRALAEEILNAAEAQSPLQVKRYGISQWAVAVNHLLDLEQFGAAKYALLHLIPFYPAAEFVHHLSIVLDHLPESAGQTKFVDDPSKELQVALREGADTEVVLFCGAGTHRLGLPLNAFHRWAGAMPATLIYLRDFRHRFYLDGIPSLGDGLQGTLEGLRRLLAQLNVRRTFCYGVSVGGFAALYYALALKAHRVLALGAAVNLEPSFNTHLRWAQGARRMNQAFPALTLDLVKQYAATPSTPRALLVYGEYDWDDRVHAE